MSGTPVEHKDCRDFVITMFAEKGIEVHVSALPPFMPSGYEEAPFTCPHGVTYWAEPTGDQRRRWEEEGTP